MNTIKFKKYIKMIINNYDTRSHAKVIIPQQSIKYSNPFLPPY